ncbi:murein hydrolase activator EnvC family protein [Pseudocolwellia sp. HL-MZ7]|uniref:murein hydrolase activator EnvC family protein n=1 Tax=Pseudocolwellia sp. HL-MZ7 TaxID=3400627 RepID=UPI003CF93098
MVVEEEHRTQSIALDKITIDLIANKKSLEKNKDKRTATLALIKKEQLSTEQQLNQLVAEEKSLKYTLEKIQTLAKSSKKLNGLAKLKRKLKWPVAGKIVHSFGTQKHGYIKWKGVLLRAKTGQQVKSIANGKVLFSDWLKGYGLVTIIDHGKGYMSLYGHNQTLLKKVGDYVEQGEPISLVGQSGGQSEPALYFEVRSSGQAQNPKLWCR